MPGKKSIVTRMIISTMQSDDLQTDRVFAVPIWSSTALVLRELHETLLACAALSLWIACAFLHSDGCNQDRRHYEDSMDRSLASDSAFGRQHRQVACYRG